MNNKNNGKYVLCVITKKRIKLHDAVPVEIIRPSLLKIIKKKYPDISHSGFIDKDEIKKIREEYIQHVLETERGELSRLEKDVLKSLVEHETLTKNINTQFERNLKRSEKISDRLAEFGGSWKFIILFIVLLSFWIILNITGLLGKIFDPYPFILLNLCLSTIAALQAPIIMMSQNRKEAKDRLRAENDYKVNLKAELEIRHLHEKLDHLTRHQWQRLLEIQQLQLDILEEQEKHLRKKKR
ncbi:MAG: DUF1003 domain-containing protein [Candidatus Woesearchaeota archaeon]